jgi:hypothetical protein
MIKDFNDFKSINENLRNKSTSSFTLTLTSGFDSGFSEFVEDEGMYDQFSKSITYKHDNKYEYIIVNKLTLVNLIKLLSYIESAPKDSLEDEIIKISVTS